MGGVGVISNLRLILKVSSCTFLHVLTILDYDKSTWDLTKTLPYQHIVEAMKYAYGQRQTLGDPAFSPIVNEVSTIMKLA